LKIENVKLKIKCVKDNTDQEKNRKCEEEKTGKLEELKRRRGERAI